MNVKELQRQILRVRERRENEKRQHDKVIRHYERQMNIKSNRIKSMLKSSAIKEHYISIARSQYDFELPFVVRKYAEFLQTMRHQYLCEIQTRVMYKQYQRFITSLEGFKNRGRNELNERQSKLIVAKNIALYCKAQNRRKGTTGRTSPIGRRMLIQQLSNTCNSINLNWISTNYESDSQTNKFLELKKCNSDICKYTGKLIITKADIVITKVDSCNDKIQDRKQENQFRYEVHQDRKRTTSQVIASRAA